MGLFIGASILTILELFDYLYEVDALFFSSFSNTLSAAQPPIGSVQTKAKFLTCCFQNQCKCSV